MFLVWLCSYFHFSSIQMTQSNVTYSTAWFVRLSLMASAFPPSSSDIRTCLPQTQQEGVSIGGFVAAPSAQGSSPKNGRAPARFFPAPAQVSCEPPGLSQHLVLPTPPTPSPRELSSCCSSPSDHSVLFSYLFPTR